MKITLVLVAISTVGILITFSSASELVYEDVSSFTCSTQRKAVSYFWKVCQDSQYSNYLQSYSQVCLSGGKRSIDVAHPDEPILRKMITSVEEANSFLKPSHRIKSREEESSYSMPLMNSCCGEEASCDEFDIQFHCADEYNFEDGKVTVCEISREYYV